MVDVDDQRSYVLDVVRVRGGSRHTLSWHGPPGEVSVNGFTRRSRSRAPTPVRTCPWSRKLAEWRTKAGYSFLYNVERTKEPPAAFTADYHAVDTRGRIAPGREPHLRIHNLTLCRKWRWRMAIPTEQGEGARRIRFVLATREGKELDSAFVTVLEPYDHTPFLARVRRLAVLEAAPGTNPVAVEVRRWTAGVDTLITCEAPGRGTRRGWYRAGWGVCVPLVPCRPS